MKSKPVAITSSSMEAQLWYLIERNPLGWTELYDSTVALYKDSTYDYFMKDLYYNLKNATKRSKVRLL